MSQALEGKDRTHYWRLARHGAAIAKRLAADGADVGITYTKGTDAAASVVKEIERAGRQAIAIHPDATDARRHGADRRRSRESSLSGGTPCGAN
jgi:3-oxoacyl-[acyl-carrier protein] reductase